MSLSNDELKHLAQLARLRIEDGELDGYRDKIGAVIEYVDQLRELDTRGVPEIASAGGGSAFGENGAGEINAFRDDVVADCPEDVRARLLAAFPRRAGDLLEVQAVFENRDE